MTGREQHSSRRKAHARVKSPACALKLPRFKRHACKLKHSKNQSPNSNKRFNKNKGTSVRRTNSSTSTMAGRVALSKQKYPEVFKKLIEGSWHFGLDLNLVLAVYDKETTMNLHKHNKNGNVVSPSNAIGPMQVKACTFRKHENAVQEFFPGEKPNIWKEEHSTIAGLAELSELTKKYGEEGGAIRYLTGEFASKKTMQTAGKDYANRVLKNHKTLSELDP